MTLVVALACTDGVILASDSQATESEGDIKFDMEKVFQLSARSVAGMSGAGQLITEIRAELEGARDMLNATPAMGTSLQSLIGPVLQKHYQPFIQVVPGLPPASPATSFLAAGCADDGTPWIIEVDPHCQYTHYEERGFHAIGSGAGFAQLANALMKHYEIKNRPLDHGRLIAYRVMRAAIDTAATGLGGDIQMWKVTAEECHQFAQEEIREIAMAVGAWEEVERDALDEFMTPADTEGDAEQMPPVVAE